MPSIEAVIGIRTHSGWAVVVAIAGETPVLRRRIEMGLAQPYHAAESMKPAAAQMFLDRTRTTAVKMAATAIRAVIAELETAGYCVMRSAVLTGSGKPLPDLAKILSAHPLLHTAEGIFFREVAQAACESCELRVTAIPERSVGPELVARAAGMSKVLGPPWTQDEKLSAAAAMSVGR